MAMISPPWELVKAAAEEIQIVDQRTGATTPWVPNDEQVEVWKALSANRLVYVLKARQVGVTTAVSLYNAIWLSINDAAGNKVYLAYVWDTESKGKERIRQTHDFLRQLQVNHTKRGKYVELPGGSRAEIITAGSKGAGRSMSYQRYHCSEVPFWARAGETWTGLQQSLGLEASCTVETTMAMDDPTAANIWRTPSDFRKVFLPFEMHDAYRRDPSDLREDQIDWMRGEGFTDLSAMSWWLYEALANRCAGDTIKCFREYPQKPEHAFIAAEGKWFRRTPEVKNPVRIMRCTGLSGDEWNVHIFKEPKHGSGQYVIGVDTARATGRDSSAIAVIDKKDDSICAAFHSPQIVRDDLALLVQRVQEEYVVEQSLGGWQRDQMRKVYAPVIIETNGPGKVTATHARTAGVDQVIEVHTTGASRHDNMLAVKRAVEFGKLYGPERLAQEADECFVTKTGDFDGPKDLSMAIGFCYGHMRYHPFNETPSEPSKEVVRIEDYAPGRRGRRRRR